VFSQEIPVRRTGHLQQDIIENTQVFTRIVEAYVRRYPDHWFWLHRRWKQR
jgi:KDO2-lipid IV(A) lauroyltransferase